MWEKGIEVKQHMMMSDTSTWETPLLLFMTTIIFTNIWDMFNSQVPAHNSVGSGQEL